MKYMGSKRWMLNNGLGHTLDDASLSAKRFVDLFAGSGAVAAHVAAKRAIPVLAYDLQKFSVVLTQAIVGRDKRLDAHSIWKDWKTRAGRIADRFAPPTSKRFSKVFVAKCRQWSEARKTLPITKAYGGHYFSPTQAVWIDALRKTLPTNSAERTAALAALIQAASESAASPGHTAQPFQPTKSAKKFLKEAWNRDICEKVNLSLGEIAKAHAQTIGKAKVADANKAVCSIKKGDLVFIDPPYSGMHYSRFYHVLETIARGQCGPVTGIGRYPSVSRRPRSRYSIKTESVDAFENLLKSISKKKARVIVTFPSHACSNGLSGKQTKKIAKMYFAVRTKTVNSKFSTLGGTKAGEGEGNGRAARQQAKELILILSPKGLPRGSHAGK